MHAQIVAIKIFNASRTLMPGHAHPQTTTILHARGIQDALRKTSRHATLVLRHNVWHRVTAVGMRLIRRAMLEDIVAAVSWTKVHARRLDSRVSGNQRVTCTSHVVPSAPMRLMDATDQMSACLPQWDAKAMALYASQQILLPSSFMMRPRTACLIADHRRRQRHLPHHQVRHRHTHQAHRVPLPRPTPTRDQIACLSATRSSMHATQVTIARRRLAAHTRAPTRPAELRVRHNTLALEAPIVQPWPM